MTVKNDNLDKDKLLEQFLRIGLDERTARNTIANNKVTANLNVVIHEAAVLDGCDRAVGNLLYTVATKYPENALIHRPILLQYITSNKVKMPAQLEAAFSFLSVVGQEDIKLNEFENACGVGVEVSVEEIEQTVNEVFKEHKSAILEQCYRINVGDLFGQVWKKHPWGDPKIVKQFIDSKLYELLGERTAADDEKAVKKKNEKHAKVDYKPVAIVTPEQPSEEELNPYLIFPHPEDNYKVHTEVFFSNGTILRCCNSKELLEKHLKATGGRVLTCFPPEPNGYLHIGHAKAMFVDFGLAKERGGGCYLRYDDTNPEAEKKEYIDHIEEIVKWMGWEPFKITYASDYFQDLYELAVELICRGHAYVDHQEYREKKMNSPWRDRPVVESLKLFDEMKQGLIEEGKATLRMKQDMQSDNFNMYDLIAYSIKFTPHPHAGDKWCIYPSYDYAHCTVDSLENITHSLCTLEFETCRASYYWLLHVLDLYQPYVWEYSRLNISNNLMSKCKLNLLVTEKWVDGWDDPRLLTLAGLRRRGATTTAIKAFIRGIGITRSDCSLIQFDCLEYHLREELNRTAPRAMVVLQPLKVVITNLENGSTLDLDVKKWPEAQADEASAFYKVPFSNIVYIEQSDFRLKDSKDYCGLAPGKSVLLRYAYPIKCTDVILADDKETVLEIRAEYDASKKSKPKGVLHWVAQPFPRVDPFNVEVRLFDKLFLSENPAELDDWLADLNPQSKVVIPSAYAVPELRNAVVGDTFQFERLGYFAVDKDSTPEKLVFNRTVTLRDSYKSSKRKKGLLGADRRKWLVRLKCCVQNYNWGVVGCNSQVARMFSLNSGSCSVDPKEYYAEFWIGTHKSGPSLVVFGRENNAAAFGSKAMSLKDWISVNPGAVLGDKVVRKWGGDLPFLFKVLSVEKALSIQAHPDKELARALHEAQPSIYKDDNHKPEMALALTGFEALCGFISSKELKGVLSSVPEIVELVQGADAEELSHDTEQDGKEKVKSLFESIFSQIMSSNKGIVREAICKLKRRLSLEKKKRQLSAKEQLVLRLEGQYPADVGVLAAFFLNYVKLKPGEALYLGPNEPHAYISGECIECMATSDNVVRAGLTSKKRDIQALLSSLNYKQGFPEILQGVPLNEYTRKYAPPFDEFEVDRCILRLAASVSFPSVPGPSLFLAMSGKGTIVTSYSEESTFREGEVLFVPAHMEVSITAATTELHIYRAGVNNRFFGDL